MLKFATDAPAGTGNVYNASTCRFSVFRNTWFTSVTATPLLIVTCTVCSLISSTPPSPPSANSSPAACAGPPPNKHNAIAHHAPNPSQPFRPCIVFMGLVLPGSVPD